ncbi:hypothetical protein [Chenggangzhangella methanolivorans]|uniref:Uncharacterized protein n=1 Tax=Chenggangzhangella methanolivorans TaxID=1437009 RepID=A0A9E6UKQ3_9HYPH|nr:hypothetical protein [Chenggangzhangella methanolivorans]QZN99641.1 hypothetical protein K6K41_23575 [Chenggangzhangella methanolivorans]
MDLRTAEAAIQQVVALDLAPAAEVLKKAGYVRVAAAEQQVAVTDAIERGIHYSEASGNVMQGDEAQELLTRKKTLRYWSLLEGVVPTPEEVVEQAVHTASYEETIVVGEAGMWVRVEDAEWFLAALWPALHDCIGKHAKQWAIDKANRTVLSTRGADSSLWAVAFKAAHSEFTASTPVLEAASERAAVVVRKAVAERRKAMRLDQEDSTGDFEKIFLGGAA